MALIETTTVEMLIRIAHTAGNRPIRKLFESYLIYDMYEEKSDRCIRNH